MTATHRNSTLGHARRLRIAAGTIQGKSLAAIAREEGVSRQTIWKQAASDDVRQIVVAAVNSELERIGRLFDQGLRVIEEAYQARVIRIGRDGKPIDLGPDHYARLAAFGQLIKVMTAGRSKPR
jgi:hypothetical protein